MIGHVELFELRRQGLKPSIVFVFDCGEPNREELRKAENQLELGCMAEIHIDPADDILKLDFRCLTDVVVSVTTNSKDRARWLYQAIKRVRPTTLTVSDGTFVHHEDFRK